MGGSERKDKMKKIYGKLTKEQKLRGVIFSSCLMTARKYSSLPIRIHEVFSTDKEAEKRIERLKDDKFFNGSDFKYNYIRT